MTTTDFFAEPPERGHAVYVRAEDVAQHLGAPVEDVLIEAIARGFRVTTNSKGSVIGVDRQKALAVRRTT